MITGKDIYDVFAAIVPLYVAMILAYGSVKWWKIFTPDQCSGINRFVAVFAVPLLSFHFISTNDPYAMDYQFIAADSLQKVVILIALFFWQTFSKQGNLEWMITLFSLSTLPNTLVMGIPLLKAMYGDFSGNLMVQIVVLQSIIWYTLMLFLFEYRGAKLLITEQFPETAASITSFRVDSDVVSLNGREPLQTDAEIGDDGKLHVVVRRSSAASSMISSFNNNKSHGFNSLTSITPRASNLTGVEIYSVQSSREPTPRASSFNQTDFYAMFASKAPSPKHGEVYSVQSSKGVTPRTSNFDEDMLKKNKRGGRSMSGEIFNNGGSGSTQTSHHHHHAGSILPSSYPPPNPIFSGGSSSNPAGTTAAQNQTQKKQKDNNNKELHMFVWSSSTTSPVSEGNNFKHKASETLAAKGLQEVIAKMSPGRKRDYYDSNENRCKEDDKDDVSEMEEGSKSSKFGFGIGKKIKKKKKMKIEETHDQSDEIEKKQPTNMPPASVMTRLILIMVWRKLIRNPNTYSSLLGVTWSLISFKWKIEMPTIIKGSISILSDAGLGMAMFSLGLFMALQPKIIACGKSVATFSMAVRFLTGPAVMAATSIAVGLRGLLLHVAIVQAALPQGIVPFVFAKEYNVHPDILSTAVIFGMLVALPITILYYVLLGL